MKLTPAQLRRIIAEEVMKQKALNEYGLGALADVSVLDTAKQDVMAALLADDTNAAVAAADVLMDHLLTQAEGEDEDAVDSAMSEFWDEVAADAMKIAKAAPSVGREYMMAKRLPPR